MDTYGRDDARGATDAYRRRSPGADRYQRDRARRRSRSPPAIDRYQPGGRDDKYRQRDEPRRRSPAAPQHIDRYVPGQEVAPTIVSNPLPNPLTLDYQVGFTWFAEWWRVDNYIKEQKERQAGKRVGIKGEKEIKEEKAKERELIQAAYDAYKEKLQIQMARTFVQQHKGEEWFKERYDLSVREPFRQQLGEFRRTAYAKWVQDIESGVFDEFTLEGIYKGEANGEGGVVEKEEGEAVAANEVLGVGDLLPTRGGDLRDEATLQPTLLIKTIAPTVSRSKLEAFCKEHLGEGEAGFRWLSLSDPNPTKKYHRIGWVLLNPSSEPTNKEEDRGDGRDGDEEMEEGAVESEGPSVSLAVAKKALEEINGKTIKDEERGDFTCHVGIHEPPNAPRKKALWDLFSAPERIERDLQLAIQLTEKLDTEMGNGFAGVTKVVERVEDLQGKGWLQPPVNAGTTKPESDDDEEGAIEDDPADDEVDDEELIVKKKTLDLLVEYLRRVHNFCLFCVFESDSVHELCRKCPGGHLRRPRASLTSSAKLVAKASAEGKAFPFKKTSQGSSDADGDSPAEEKKPAFQPGSKTYQQLQKAFNWVKTYEDKLLQILDPESVDLRKIGGKPLDDGLEEELAKYVKQEDEAKFRCKVPDCTKLFKGQVFWRKHVEKRHEEFFNKIKSDVILVNNYVLDPAHIAPSRSDANSNGHFPLSNHGQAGTPRGFNLANAPFSVPSNGNAPSAIQIAQFMAQHGMAAQWAVPPGADGDHAGVRRTGAGRFNSRVAGPYDRNGKDQRSARWNSSGRLSPVRGKLMNPRFSDGGGAGPREAVQGRALKSYEDLDATTTGNGTAALDY
ncbi:hypothetical protein, variant 2 [Verruconis gallopava]|uniref:C2H2-type domain-containing protein n=1 Tax=Verruconis gallopava TaxID=253628 RepID=A0A0D1Z3V1_9PEZI|nr:uncharacterized protein PV09_01598 [Verruconis gallopava]XP_016217526.1 hypothetical protein, variant 1 [Verruconis gallopava]XP_016217527.1 hypothetical protein, variant 2 [Verruconis gallopava]KIW07656.1 hypothetical protein PV09_01598 [Verruconis gallopava]KIW07657.1 hypothetical protein, variant 1 [Verruconis gallopava]KIW07658.1 hypothetical protein, variant 2 [Verruconis gallopava]